MSIYVGLKSALAAIWVNRLHSLFALSGMIIGAMACLIAISFMRGISMQAHEQAQYTQILFVLLLCIAVTSCIAGGLTIMCSLLLSLMGRTREFGLRLAIGARQRDIRNQVLMEAVLLSMIAAGLSIMPGLLLGTVFTWMVHLPFSIDLVSLLLLLSIAACVGSVFGFYPAVCAARLDPSDALRTRTR